MTNLYIWVLRRDGRRANRSLSDNSPQWLGSKRRRNEQKGKYHAIVRNKYDKWREASTGIYVPSLDQKLEKQRSSL